MLKKIYNLILRNLMNDPNKKFVSKDTGNKSSLKKSLSMFSTGITVVTTVDKNKDPIGMTVNSFASVSLCPALVLWSIDKTQPSYDTFLKSDGYAVNILTKNQENFCSLFSSPVEDKFKNLEWELSDDGHPIIKNTLAWFNCVKWKDYDGGDHQILVGEVKSYNYIEDEPLLYWNGKIT